MSTDQTTAVDHATPIHEFTIPSMVTISADEVLQHFGENIIELQAHAAADTDNVDELNRDYGLLRRQKQREKVELNYQRQANVEGEPYNPLTPDARTEILNQTRRLLNPTDSTVLADLAVTKLVIRTEVPAIRNATRAQSDEFEFTFVSDRVLSDAAKEATQQANLEKALFTELGFEYRNLNLRSVIETRAKYTEQSTNGKVMGWGGPDDTRGRCSHDISQAVKQHVLPAEYAKIKWFEVTEDHTLETRKIEAANSVTAAGDE